MSSRLNLFRFAFLFVSLIASTQAAEYSLASSAVGRYVTHSANGNFQADQEYGALAIGSSSGNLTVVSSYIWDLPLDQTFGLSIANSGGQILLRWPLVSGTVVVEKATTLNGTVSWQPVGIAPVQTNGTYQINIPADGPSAYFRLRLE